MPFPVVSHPDYLTYHFGPAHPFSPVRLEMLWDLLHALGAAPVPVLPEPVTDADLLAVHEPDFVQAVMAASGGQPLPDAQRYGLDTGDVPIFPGMDAASRILVGGTLKAAQLVMDGVAPRALQLGGGLHHALPGRASGFCVYNDLSVAIRAFTRAGYRVAYLDIDVHHGDGVQWIHYREAEVLTISLHESGQYLFPGTGFPSETGEGPGAGTAINVPFPPHTGDAAYLAAFEAVVPQALTRFAPDVLVVQCGADAHANDPLAHLNLSTRAYERLFRRILELADIHTGGKAVFTLGGGYNLDATVRIWCLLTLLFLEHDLPQSLPPMPRLTSTLHDE